MNKLSRKDIAMLEVLAVTQESKDKLAEYVQQQEKAAKAYKAFREAVVNGVEVEKVEKVVEVKRKFKLGDKVRVLDVSHGAATSALDVGDITEVVGYKDEFKEYELLAPEERPVVVAEPEGETGLFEESALELVKEKSPNGLRAEVIQRAKAVLVEWKDRDGSYLHPSPCGFYFNTRVEFKVNAEKRVVVALLRNLGITENIRTRGIASCSKSDVYNEHIGKAIALGRALGKDVSEFENAVQPNFEVGQIVEYVSTHAGETSAIQITQVDSRGLWFVNTFGTEMCLDPDVSKIKFVNDTDAQYRGIE